MLRKKYDDLTFQKISPIDKEQVDMFLAFPKLLYAKNKCPQDIAVERDLLNNKHTLSHHFKIAAYMLLANDKVLCRCMVTVNETEQGKTACIGFFESVNDVFYSKYFFEQIEKTYKQLGFTELFAGIDASFWIGYRTKTLGFEDNYTGEPMNKAYYEKIYVNSGYSVKNNYVSNFMDLSYAKDISNEILNIKSRLAKHGKHYKVEDLHGKNKEDVLERLFELFSSRYNDFPFFHDISKAEFYTLFSDMFKITNKDYVLFAFDEKGDIVAFTIAVPDYGTLLKGKITPLKLIKILAIKKHPKRLVNLYMGVEKKHLGAGTLLTYALAERINVKKIPVIAALIMENKITGNYFKECIVKQSKYVTWQKML